MDMVRELDRRVRKRLHNLMRHTIEVGIMLALSAIFTVAMAVAVVLAVIIIGVFAIWMVIPLGIVAGLCAVGIILYAAFEVRIEILERRYRLHTNSPINYQAELPRHNQDNNEEDTCIVCLDRERNAAILPCEHDKFCYSCAERCRNEEYEPRCPICRGPIVHVMRFPSTS